MAVNYLWHQYLCKTIGFRHDFLCINICWAPREVLKPSPFRLQFQHSLRAQQVLRYQKSMFDRYYCIKHFFRSKTLEKLLQKVLFTCTYNGAEKSITCECFENATPGQGLTSSLLCMLLIMTSVFFVMDPKCLFIKPQSRLLTAHELSC